MSDQDEALQKLQELSDAMEEDRIKVSDLSTWDIDFLKNMSLSYEDYKNGSLNLTPKQIIQIKRIYSEHFEAENYGAYLDE